MNKAVCVRGLAIGSGMPKICVPVMGGTQDEVLESARGVVGSGADFAEWRADYFEAVGDLQQTEETAAMLREILQGLPLLFTFRTAKEGGERDISFEDYERLLLHMADSGTVDMIDVEVFRGYDGMETEHRQENLGAVRYPIADFNVAVGGNTRTDGVSVAGKEDFQMAGCLTSGRESSPMAAFFVTDRENERMAGLIQALKEKAVVIGSYHDFKKTPKREEMLARLLFMDRLGVDIPKLAVMPESREDVLLLMETTALADRLLPDKPLITMSMGAVGVVSRIAGGQFGSAVTFGCMGRASAPGQMESGELRNILTALYEKG